MRCSGLFTWNESSDAHGGGRPGTESIEVQNNPKQGAMTEIEIAAIERPDRP
jgi:hypothetical protein